MNDMINIIRRLAKYPDSNQRELSEYTNYSLGKTNKLVNQALNGEYITVNPTELTAKGKLLLEEHRVDNAIVLASGIGERFVDSKRRRPKALLKIDGETLLDRLIRQLKAVNIKTIYIIIGYEKEQFEYLKEDPAITLIYNKDYLDSNNLITLAKGIDFVNNTYILPSDIYYKENIFNEFEYTSWLGVQEGSSEDTWTVKIGKERLIVDILENNTTGPFLSGPAFIHREQAEAFKACILKESQYRSQRYYFWENALNKHLNTIPVQAKNTQNLVEFNTREELDEFRNSYYHEVYPHQFELIEKVFQCKSEDITNFKPTDKGMTNDSFTFFCNNTKYILRSPGVGTSQLINRKQEADVYQTIRHLKISDTVLYIDPNTGEKISKYYDDAQALEDSDLKTAIGMVRSLHQSGLTVEHEFNIWDQMEWYIQLCNENKQSMYRDFKERYKDMMKLKKWLKSLNLPLVLCHVDPVYDNFIKIPDGRIKLLDWEYAGMSQAYLDIAMHGIYSNMNETDIQRITEYYFEEKPSDLQQHIVYAYVAAGGFLWSLWTLYKESMGDNFDDYGMQQYTYARTYSKKVLKYIEENKNA